MHQTPDSCAIFRGAWTSQRVAEGNAMEFTKKCRALHTGRNILKHLYILGADQLESSFPKKGLSVLGNNNRSQQYTLEVSPLAQGSFLSGDSSPFLGEDEPHLEC